MFIPKEFLGRKFVNITIGEIILRAEVKTMRKSFKSSVYPMAFVMLPTYLKLDKEVEFTIK